MLGHLESKSEHCVCSRFGILPYERELLVFIPHPSVLPTPDLAHTFTQSKHQILRSEN